MVYIPYSPEFSFLSGFRKGLQLKLILECMMELRTYLSNENNSQIIVVSSQRHNLAYKIEQSPRFLYFNQLG